MPVHHHGGCNGQAQPDVIPHGQVFHRALPVTSPPQGPPTDNGQESNILFSPSSSQTGSITEPRNYAPRTSGQPVMEQPPPKFNLDVVAYRAQGNANDPFVASSRANGVCHPVPVTQTVGFPATNTLAQRSQKLRTLLGPNSMLPSFNTAMHPDNFPFAETCRKGKAINHGVVKIRNVSRRSCMIRITTNSGMNVDSVCYQACRGRGVPWAQLAYPQRC